MNPAELLFLTIAVAAIAFLYSSVGHAGASGYIAVMSLAGLTPDAIKPTSLMLNVLVASITSWQFMNRGHFSFKLLWPFAILAVPMAFLGGYLNLPVALFKFLVGAVLLFSAARFLAKPGNDSVVAPPALFTAILWGGILGLFAGITGTGGGIFLTPLLLTMRWTTTKTAAGVSAMFILLNSVSGLMGNFSSTGKVPSLAIPLALAVIVAGSAGSWLGSGKLKAPTIKRLLAAVLLIAGLKFVATAVVDGSSIASDITPETTRP